MERILWNIMLSNKIIPPIDGLSLNPAWWPWSGAKRPPRKHIAKAGGVRTTPRAEGRVA